MLLFAHVMLWFLVFVVRVRSPERPHLTPRLQRAGDTSRGLQCIIKLNIQRRPRPARLSAYPAKAYKPPHVMPHVYTVTL